nr:hypothetical protein [Tanacetum cinerariifolium]
MEKEENRALQMINETPAQKATKRRKLNKEVEDLKRHLQIVPNEDDDVYTKATPLARKKTNVVPKIKRLEFILGNNLFAMQGDKMVIQSKSLELHSESHVIYSESHVIHSESHVIHFESHVI